MSARVWRLIFSILDTPQEVQRACARVRWVPAHLSPWQIGKRRLPCGTVLSAELWRANRLADALAKRGARSNRTTTGAARAYRTACAAARYEATLLGRATVGANHCPVEVDDGQGGTRKMMRSDARRVPARQRAAALAPEQPGPATTAWVEAPRTNVAVPRVAEGAAAAADALPPAGAPASSGSAPEGAAASAARRACERFLAPAASADALDAAFWAAWCDRQATTVRRAPTVSGRVRLAALQRRVVSRAAAG